MSRAAVLPMPIARRGTAVNVSATRANALAYCSNCGSDETHTRRKTVWPAGS